MEEEEAAGRGTAPEARRGGSGSASCPIVGIGASAGGIDALKRLFHAAKPGAGLAFIVLQHLDPERESVLADILDRATDLAVAAIEEGTIVEADHVYVVPPNAAASIHEGRLTLARPTAPRGQRNLIDELFVSLRTIRARTRRAPFSPAPAAMARWACARSRAPAASRSRRPKRNTTA